MFGDVLNDRDAKEREIGMRLGFQWGALAEVRAVYCDLGISPGMELGIANRPAGQLLEFRYLDPLKINRCIRCGTVTAPDTQHCGATACAVFVVGGLRSVPPPVPRAKGEP